MPAALSMPARRGASPLRALALHQATRAVLPGLIWAVCSVAVAAPLHAQERRMLVTMLAVNDLDRAQAKDGAGGLARLATVLLDEQDRRDTEVYLFHAGDAISPSMISSFDQGAHMIEGLNQIRPTAMALGNHEFDFGPDVLRQRLAEAQFPVLATNVTQADGTLLPGTRRSLVLTAGPLRIGVVGVTTPRTAVSSSPGDTRFADPITAVRQEAAALRADGADLVVALAHLDVLQDLELVRAGVADVIISGDDHHMLQFWDGRTVLVESGEQGEVVTAIDLSVTMTSAAAKEVADRLAALESDRDTLVAGMATLSQRLSLLERGDVATAERAELVERLDRDWARLEALDSDISAGRQSLAGDQSDWVVSDIVPRFRLIDTRRVDPDALVADWERSLEERLDQKLGVEIGTAATALDSRRPAVRGGEAAIGNLIADALRAATQAEVALTNGGGIRADRTYDAGATLTARDILSELPFGNKTVVLRLTGAQIRAAIDHGVGGLATLSGRFPQIAGMTAVVDPAAPAGARVLEMTIGGEPVDDDRSYTLATNDYLARGGDGYAMFTEAERLVEERDATLMADDVIAYVQAAGSVAPRVEGRLVLRSGNP